MPKIAYIERKFYPRTLDTIEKANEIIEEYSAQGYDLTLRQLYYQFVARALIPNKQNEYNKLGSIINDARLAGLVDWSAITDRTRNLKRNSHWSDPADIINSALWSFALDKWENQSVRLEVWIEKDALRGIAASVCEKLDVPHFSCRGYVSQSEMWNAAQRLARHKRLKQQPIILHLGDHDPSGIDMTRDIKERLALLGANVEVKRLALNMDQIQTYKPPPNPAKMSDSRFKAYKEEYGNQSWELDALEPSVLSDLIREAIISHRDDEKWSFSSFCEEEGRAQLKTVASRWDDVISYLES